MKDDKVLKEVAITINTGLYYYGPEISDLEMEELAVEHVSSLDNFGDLVVYQKTITSKDRHNIKFDWDVDYSPYGDEDITLWDVFDKITELEFDSDGSVLINGERYIKAALPVRKKTKKLKNG